MATHSSVLAWRIPGTGEPGGLPSMGSHRVWHDWSDAAAAAAAAFFIKKEVHTQGKEFQSCMHNKKYLPATSCPFLPISVLTNVYSFLDTLSEIFCEVFYTYISIYMIFFFVTFYWDKTDTQHYISNFRYTTWWFDIYGCCEMITTISLVDICHHTYLWNFFFLWWELLRPSHLAIFNCAVELKFCFCLSFFIKSLLFSC